MSNPKPETILLSPSELDRIISAIDRLPEAYNDEAILGEQIFWQHTQWAHLFTEKKYDAGQVIYVENDPGDSAFIIMSGKLAAIRGDFSSPVILGCREKGQSIGEMALLDGLPRSASVVALEPMVLMEISRSNFHIMIKEEPSFAQNILRLLSVRLREASEAIENVTVEKIQDPLTSLYNRRYMEIMFGHELQRARRAEYPVSIIMMDIDHFKNLNDTYGHPAGDEVLRSLAKLIKQQVRSTDIACRYGGEEILIILPETALEVAAERAEVLRAAFSETAIEYGGQVMQSSISLGVAVFPLHGENSKQLIQGADLALYAAKNDGRNRVNLAKRINKNKAL
jgi:diguanylate cyclase (GGDEF)-like protein